MPGDPGQSRGWLAQTGTAIVDLILPSACAGCAVAGEGQLCPGCRAGLAGLVPLPARPTPPPVGMPPCSALGAYEGPLRGLLLAYKEHGAHRLAAPLGDHLARAVASRILSAGASYPMPVVVVPVPATAAAVRERHGDHMVRLARRAVRALRRSGWPAACGHCVVALPKADSSHLSAEERAAAATSAFRVRARRVRRVRAAADAGAFVIVVDDILTTGSTIAAVTTALQTAGVTVAGGATIAATRRRKVFPDRVRIPRSRPDVGIST